MTLTVLSYRVLLESNEFFFYFFRSGLSHIISDTMSNAFLMHGKSRFHLLFSFIEYPIYRREVMHYHRLDYFDENFELILGNRNKRKTIRNEKKNCRTNQFYEKQFPWRIKRKQNVATCYSNYTLRRERDGYDMTAWYTCWFVESNQTQNDSFFFCCPAFYLLI